MNAYEAAGYSADRGPLFDVRRTARAPRTKRDTPGDEQISLTFRPAHRRVVLVENQNNPDHWHLAYEDGHSYPHCWCFEPDEGEAHDRMIQESIDRDRGIVDPALPPATFGSLEGALEWCRERGVEVMR